MKIIKFLILLYIFFYVKISNSQELTVLQEDALDELFQKSVDDYYGNNYVEAIENCSELIDKSTEYNSNYHKFNGYNVLTLVYTSLSDSINARQSGEKALEIALQTEVDSLISRSYINLGNIYSKNRNTYNKGIQYFENSIAISEKTNSLNDIYLGLTNLVWTYLNFNDNETAYIILLKVKELETQNSYEFTNEDRAYIDFLFGKYYANKKNYNLAENKLISAVTVANRDSINDLSNEIYSLLNKMYKEDENYEKAYLSLEKVNFYNNLILKQNQTEAIEKATASYKLTHYKHDLERANKEKQYSDELAAKSKETSIIFIIATSILLIVISILFLVFKSRKNYLNKLRNKNIELISAKYKAEKLSKVKTQFLSTVSHELRTPLYGVIGIATILQEDKQLKKRYEQDLNSLKFSADYLLALINDVLLLNKVDAGAIKLGEIPYQLDVLINSITRTFEFSLEQNKNKLHINIDNNIPNYLIGDSIRFSQILMNLIGNAIKFNENGNVWLDIKLNKIKENGTYETLFIIKDDGIGIPLDKQEAIFDEFSQVDNKNFSYKGTGLGLPIVKKLLDLHNSKIHLKSEIGKGSEFSFSLELVKNHTYKELEKANLSIEDLKESLNLYNNAHILIVDDNIINQKITQRILEKYDFKFSSVANDGEQAINMTKSNNYDLILMDINMPNVNGIEATKAIRNFNSFIPIIALTAVDIDEMRTKILDSGMNDIILKPYDVSQFLSTILQNLSKKQNPLKRVI